MSELDKKSLTEQDIRTKFITPALVAGSKWDVMNQIREEVYFTKGRVIVKGQGSTRAEPKKADYVLSYKPGVPLAVVEAKDNNHPIGGGMQQALEYAEILDVPFVFSSNGDAFLFHDRTGQSQPVEQELKLEDFPSASELWQRYCAWKGLTSQQIPVVAQDYCQQGPDKEPRYYQEIPLYELQDAVGRDYDPFDLVCHVAYDQPPLTRKERAENVRKRNYFARYGDKTRAVMEAILNQYSDQGLEAIESSNALKVTPFSQLGTPVEIIKTFGGRAQFQAALRDLENQIYETP